MTADNFNLSDYLSRIGFEGDTRNDEATLTQLIQRQLRTIVFENTEVQAGRIPSLVPEDIVEKVIVNRRGGYCYEINGVFAMALTAIGFEWYFAGARSMLYPTRRPKTHMVLIVRVDGRYYLCDTGFGGYALRAPMEIMEDEAVQDGDRFRLEIMDGEYVLGAMVQGEWQRLYGFAMQPQEWIEFSLANYFNATSPDTVFTQKKIAIMQTPNGRKILIDNELKLIEEGKMEKLEVDYDSALKEYFDLEPLRG
ncbi:MAG: acetyltransferase [Sulfuricurvum sp. MLSB]|uniref:arylamine N-acetyltransferase family protein n=1 Tax=unclassified Sulfuricurvum TaxID=2632390 RepID=UPI000507F993|nr:MULTISPECIES: arylamine N-acetyltransferase [unclassified Sulfuricurvum]KFN38744.1 MAG: acetyltransferase [Sulfuricurvum sp. MLSB]